jgi:transcriptional regulator with XRE-family HTH domain
MLQLIIQDLAKAQGLSLSKLQRRADISMMAARRYWYATRDGKAEGETLHELDLAVLQAIANVLGVDVLELFHRTTRTAQDQKEPTRPAFPDDTQSLLQVRPASLGGVILERGSTYLVITDAEIDSVIHALEVRRRELRKRRHRAL